MTRILLATTLWAVLSAALSAAPELRSGEHFLRLDAVQPTLRIGVAPKFMLGSTTLTLRPLTPAAGAIDSGKPLRIACEPQPVGPRGRLEAVIAYQWSQEEKVLRKWVRFRLTGGTAPALLKEIELETLEPHAPAPGTAPSSAGESFVLAPLPRSDAEPQSYPVFFQGGFAGVEFPMARTRTAGDRITIAHAPGLTVEPNTWYETRRAVIGAAPLGCEREAFIAYIERQRPSPRGLHFNYNSWWTSPVPYSERDILSLMQAFDERLFRPYGVSFDTFAIDMGWGERRGIWRIDTALFPAGFGPLNDAAVRMRTRLGLWISPSGSYAGSAGCPDNHWAHGEGYETFVAARSTDPGYRHSCLAGQRYRNATRDSLVEMVARRGVRHIKLDGYRPTCPEASHGHAPGLLSADAVAAGIIEICSAVRRAAPDTWLEATCFGWNPSPWWLCHVNSVIGTFGDDAPPGRVPCPVYRESYTTARDFYNLQGAVHLPIPAAAQEVLGIIHQTSDPLLNDAVMSVMRGHMFQSAYINPAHMNESRWQQLAELIRWARAHEAALAHTEPIVPATWKRAGTPRFTSAAPMPREPYGYVHWGTDGGLIALRNPWIEPQTICVDVPEALRGKHAVVSIYPEARAYRAAGLDPCALNVPLRPYETLVLAIGTTAANIKPAAERPSPIVVQAIDASVSKATFAASGARQFGPDYTRLLADGASVVRVAISGEVEIQEAQAELLVLLEGDGAAPSVALARIQVDGHPAETTTSDSETGWRASGEQPTQHWQFLRVPLGAGQHRVSGEVLAAEPCTASAWIWAYVRNGDQAPAQRGLLPSPEQISLDAIALFKPAVSSSLPDSTQKLAAPTERINGVFLDALEPVQASQSWGKLQRNRSVWGKPMTIAGQRYLRGVGTHATSRLTYRIDPDYKRFQAWAGLDSTVSGSIAFEIWVDGKRKWESGRVTRNTPAARVDIDVSGAHTLELLVTDGGDNIGGDHANWAEARFLR